MPEHFRGDQQALFAAGGHEIKGGNFAAGIGAQAQTRVYHSGKPHHYVVQFLPDRLAAHATFQRLPTEASYTYKLELVFRAKPANIDDLLVGLSVIINRFVSNHASKTLATEPNQN